MDKVVIPNHWDDFFRPLSKPLRPHYESLKWAFPPLQRVNLDAFRQVIERIAPETRVFVPEIFHVYDLEEFV